MSTNTKENIVKELQVIRSRKTQIMSRVVGYHRPVDNWNKGKKEEFKNRAEYTIK